MDDLNRLLSDLQTNKDFQEWLFKSANDAAADVILADVGYDVYMSELRAAIEEHDTPIDLDCRFRSAN